MRTPARRRCMGEVQGARRIGTSWSALLALSVSVFGSCSPAAGPGAAALERLALEELPIRGLPLPARAEDKLEPALRAHVMPSVRRDAPLRLCVDHALRADWKVLGAALDAAGLDRSERAALTWELLAAEQSFHAPFEAWLSGQGGIEDRVRFRGLARTCFTGSERVARAAVERGDVAQVSHVPELPPDLPEPRSPPPREPATDADLWALEALGAPTAWARGHGGQGVVVAVLDSGIDPAHPALAGRSVGTFAPRSPRGRGRDHGMQVLAAAVGSGGLGVAPEALWASADPIPEDIHDPRLFAACIEWLLRDVRPHVVVAPWDTPPGLAQGPGLRRAFEVLRTAGAATVFPAGNTGPAPGENRPPANLPSLAPDGAPALSVAGIDRDRNPYWFSNRGPSAEDGSAFPQVAAPAVRVGVLDPSGSDRAVIAEGTSFAAGFAAGALALILDARPELTGPEAEAVLRGSCRDLGEPGHDPVFGHGLIDLDAATSPR